MFLGQVLDSLYMNRGGVESWHLNYVFSKLDFSEIIYSA